MLKIQRDWSRTIFTLWTPLCLQTHNIIPQKMFCSHIKMTKEDNRSIDTLNLIASCSILSLLIFHSILMHCFGNMIIFMIYLWCIKRCSYFILKRGLKGTQKIRLLKTFSALCLWKSNLNEITSDHVNMWGKYCRIGTSEH
jgi:hypothetical protein